MSTTSHTLDCPCEVCTGALPKHPAYEKGYEDGYRDGTEEQAAEIRRLKRELAKLKRAK